MTVLGGQPWPILDEGVGWVPVPSLDLYREPDPFRVPRPREFRSLVDVGEFGLMCTAGFPEPWSFSMRARRVLRRRGAAISTWSTTTSASEPACSACSTTAGRCSPRCTTRSPSTATSSWPTTRALIRQMTLRRWYGFLRMQMRVAAQIPRIVTVSQSSARDITDPDGRARRPASTVVPVGVDQTRLPARCPASTRDPDLIMTTASSDVPLKGLVPLLEALAKVRTEHGRSSSS